MEKWECLVCGYIYDEEKGDPDNGVGPGTRFKDLPDDWVYPDIVNFIKKDTLFLPLMVYPIYNYSYFDPDLI